MNHRTRLRRNAARNLERHQHKTFQQWHKRKLERIARLIGISRNLLRHPKKMGIWRRTALHFATVSYSLAEFRQSAENCAHAFRQLTRAMNANDPGTTLVTISANIGARKIASFVKPSHIDENVHPTFPPPLM